MSAVRQGRDVTAIAPLAVHQLVHCYEAAMC